MLRIVAVALLAALAAAAWLLAAPLGLPAWAPAWLTVAALVVALALVIHAALARAGRRRRARLGSRDPGLVALASHVRQELDRLRAAGDEDVPWTLVIGPGGAGKTAALWRSGLAFLPGFEPQRFAGEGDVQATDRVAFYRAPSGVFVDTPGRMSAGATPGDRAEWRLLLDLLAREGPRRPLAAVLVVVPVPALVGGDAAALAALLRARVDEVQQALAVVAPVHVLCTQVDALAGLGPLCAALPGDRLGFAVEVSGPGAEGARRIAERHLAGLADALEVHAFEAAGAGSPVGAAAGDVARERAELLRAPAHFAALARGAADLVAALFPDHGGIEAPIWRSLLFATAGAPAPHVPADPVLAGALAAAGDPPRRAAPPLAAPGRPRLLAALFASILPADRWVAAWSPRRRRRELLSMSFWACSFGLVSIALAALAATAAAGNHRLIGRTSAALAALARDRGDAAPIRPDALAPVQALAHLLRDHAAGAPPWRLRAGLYQGAALAAPLWRLYLDRAGARLLRPLVERRADDLRALVAAHRRAAAELPAELYRPAVDALRLYLLLTRDGGRLGLAHLGEPEEGARVAQRRWLSDQLAAAWAESAPGAEIEDLERVAATFVADLEALAAAGELPAAVRERDDALVERARAILRRTPRGQRWAEAWADEDLPGAAAITVASLAPGAPWLHNEGRRVRPAFTLAGWEQLRTRVRCPAAAEDFYVYAGRVIDGHACERELAALHAGYFKRYVQEWNHFLDTIEVIEPQGYEATRALIEEMTPYQEQARNDLQELFAAVARHAQLPPAGAPRGRPEVGGVMGAVRRVVRVEAERRGKPDPFAVQAVGGPTIDTVRRALEPFYRYGYPTGEAPLDAYMAVLMKIQGPLGLYLQQREEGRLEEARKYANDVAKLLSEEQLPQLHPQWRPVLERLLLPPIRGLLDEVRRGELDQITQRWCNEVVDPFDLMRACYPFTADAECQATASEVAEVFHPTSGAIWRLYDAALAARFPFQGDRYGLAAPGFGARYKPNPRVAEFLTHARELGEVLFPAGAEGPRLDLAVQFLPATGASRVALTVDGVSESYNNNSKDHPRPMTWPGRGGDQGARLVVHVLAGAQEVTGDGFWGLFKLLEKGELIQEPRFVRARFRLAGGVELLIWPENGPGTPIFGRLRPDARPLDVFRAPRLVAPRSLFLGGKSCPSKFGAAAAPRTESTANPP